MKSNLFFLIALVVCAAILVGTKALVDTLRAAHELQQELDQQRDDLLEAQIRRQCADRWPLRGQHFEDCVSTD